MISLGISGSLIAGIMFDEVVIAYPSGTSTVMQYKYKGNVVATVTETVNTDTPPKMIHLVRT
jgi:predicted Na+-dependent transporter